MARYTQASCKKCRKHQTKLFLKGSKCYSKCILDREKAPVRGKFSGGKPRSKQSEYSVRLAEKQKARIAAGMTERPFSNLFAKASRSEGQTGEIFLRYLETRLDNVVRRLGFAMSLKFARQLVLHKHVKVNARVVNIPSFQVRPGDKVALDLRLKENTVVKAGLEETEKRSLRPSFLEFDAGTLTGKLSRWPDRAEVSYPVQEQLIVEHYSK